MNIYPLSEGVFTIGHDKIFVPFDEHIHDLQQRSIGSLLVEIQPFLIQTNNQLIILDTGLGYKNDQGELQIHANLNKLGIKPEQIDKVILSHLHKDHAGGIAYKDDVGSEKLTFPEATYYVVQEEFDYAVAHAGKSYTIDDFAILKNSLQTTWLSSSETIDGFISVEVSGGHCPHHACIKINTAEGIIFFGADVAPQLKQLKTKYVAKYDVDGQKSMELRQQFAHQGKLENWTFLFYHDVKTPIAQL